MQLCQKCHKGKKGHVCDGVYAPARQAVVNERRRGKDPDNRTPLFGIAHKKRGEDYVIRGVFAPYDLRVMTGEFESFEEMVQRTEHRKARPDDWNDYCHVCEGKGGVTMCMGCNLVFHEKCLVLKTISEGLGRNEELVCPECIGGMRVASRQ